MGYDTPDDEQLLSMLMMDSNREFRREMRDSGLRVSIRDLIQLKIHGVALGLRAGSPPGRITMTSPRTITRNAHSRRRYGFFARAKDAGTAFEPATSRTCAFTASTRDTCAT
jgi:hypothetical protein